MSPQEIKICLERMTMSKTSDVMNFDYGGTLEYIKRLENENAELKDQWDNLRCVYSFDGEVMEYCVNAPCPHDRTVASVREENNELKNENSELRKTIEVYKGELNAEIRVSKFYQSRAYSLTKQNKMLKEIINNGALK